MNTDPPASERNLPPGARGPRLGEIPTISVVVASRRDLKLLNACLNGLLPQCRQVGADIFVARAGAASELAELAAAYPTVHFIAGPVDATIPVLRAAGMAAADGDIVALTEDHCVVAPNWLAELAHGSERGAQVIGGAMENAQRDRAIDWAAYFAEYGFFAGEGGDAGTAPLLTAANVAYRREVIEEVVAWARQGEWENVAHARLLARGSALEFRKTAAVYQNQNYRLGEFCRDRYVHGRNYARRRLADETPSKRWLYLVGSLALPFLLVGRVGRAAGPGRWWAFCRALPFTFVFLAAWSAGEAAGYLLGPTPAERSDG